MKSAPAIFISAALALQVSPAFAVTWGKIEFLPKEAFWDEELGIYLLSDSYTLGLVNPDKEGLARALQITCAPDTFSNTPGQVFFDVTILFEGMGAKTLPVTKNDADMDIFDSGQAFQVRIATPGRAITEDWNWVRYEVDYVSGSPKPETGVMTYQEIRNSSWVTIETLGEIWTVEPTSISGYFQAFERICAGIT